ncbi:uncharacterized protein LOC129775550 [Toxorhynchites rutilus septentrionalis]|uniref:uncharacterized protein LOC129775550 n=1 Tax=Toxorhynchites rutilus septentrionalis TaxID=329112 RepID=UPI002478B83B|nr:uncharacterized protein LOC129775550 [Toxorhynchites rutilus septentrionalis]XP_055636381.1 uncharacterized protein LOC129775550 [Toxorhynchites rutilus septentrionalis]
MGLARAVTNVIKDSDAVVEMAPALTEPLSPNKLSSSAASGASPRTGVETSGQQEIPSASADSGTETVSTAPPDPDVVLRGSNCSPGIEQVEDDIQNNNSGGGQLAKIDSDSGKDLIELALEQLHQDATAAPANVAGADETAGDNSLIASALSQAVIDHISEVATTSEQVVASDSHSDLQQLDSQSSIISSSSTAMGLQKDYLKDNPDMEQMLGELASTSDMELLQVFKSLEGNPSGDGLCAELAGGLSLFNDVDVNIYEEVAQTSSPNKDRERLEMHAEIVKRQAQMQRKYDFLIRRLSKLQARYMGQHVSEEIAGLFEYTQRYWKKKDKEHTKGLASGSSTVSPTSSLIPDIIPYQPPPPSSADKMKPISTNAMKTFVKRLEGIAVTQCSTQAKRIYGNRYFQGTATSPGGDSGGVGTPGGAAVAYTTLSTTIPKFENAAIVQLEQTAGLLHSELKLIQNTMDSEATASSSGGESADEMVLYNNMNQQSLLIAKRAAWRWAKDRASVASRWTWLQAQIADLEYRIRQYNELHNKIKINKGAVTLEEVPTTQQAPPQQSVNGYRGTLPGNNKPLDDSYDAASSSTTTPNGAYDQNGASCRTRPFHRNGFRKRKLLQTANMHIISKKVARPSTIKCGCAWPLHPCALCSGRQDPTAPRDLADTMPATERVALLDPCYHPVLSFSEDVSHSIHFEAIHRIPEWQNKMIRTSTKSLSKSVSQKSASAGGSGLCSTSGSTPAFPSSGDEGAGASGSKKIGPDGKRKYTKHNKLNSSQDFANSKNKKSNSRRNLLLANTNSRKSTTAGYPQAGPSGSSSQPYGASSSFSGSSNRYYKSRSNKYRKASLSATMPLPASSASRNRYSSSGVTGSFDYMDSSGLQHDGAGSNSSRSKNSSPTPYHHRNERRNRNSYDIDNIVIPHSIAAANRTEILPYKEIPTPRWRIIRDQNHAVDKESDSTSLTGPLDTSQTVQIGEEANNINNATSIETKQVSTQLLPPLSTATQSLHELANVVPSVTGGQMIVLPAIDEEDISDDTFLAKHERALQEERKKFQSYMKFPWSRPRANRRIDSRAGSSEANTPDPTSPAPPIPLVDHESNTSPACPSTPLTPLDSLELSETNVINAFNQSLNKKERRRTVSTKFAREDIQVSGTPEFKEVVAPYDSLEFPLPDDVYDEMIRLMPSDHLILIDDTLSKLTRPNRPNNNMLLLNKNNLDLIPSSSGLISNPMSSNMSTTSTTLSATENDIDDLDCDDNEDDLLAAKKVESQIIMEKLLKSCDESRIFVGAPQVVADEEDPMDDEETDTGESLFVEEDDPNDPEWYDRPGRGRT